MWIKTVTCPRQYWDFCHCNTGKVTILLMTRCPNLSWWNMFYTSGWFGVFAYKQECKKKNIDLFSMTVWYWWDLRWHSRPWQCCSVIMSEMPPSHQVARHTWKQSDDPQMIGWPSTQEVLQPVALYDGLTALDSKTKPNSEQEEVICKSNATTITLPTNTQRVTIKRVILLWNGARWPW